MFPTPPKLRDAWKNMPMIAIIASRPLASSADLSWLCRPYANVNTILPSYAKLLQLTKVDFGRRATKDYITYPLPFPTHMSRSVGSGQNLSFSPLGRTLKLARVATSSSSQPDRWRSGP